MTFTHVVLHGQSFTLRLLYSDAGIEDLPSKIDLPGTSYRDTTSLLNELGQFITDLHSAGHLEASADTLVRADSNYSAIIHLGPVYEWLQLTADSVPPNWLSKVGFRERLYRNKPLMVEQWLELQRQLAKTAANNGFPFAQIRLTDLQWGAPGRVSARIAVTRGELMFFEQLEIEGNAAISTTYLENHLGLLPGQPYNEATIQRVPARIRELPFVQLSESPKVRFIGNQARLVLKLSPRKASRFDFVVGVLPRSPQTGRLLVTAQLDGALQNSLGKGEQITFAFEQLRPLTQELQLSFQYPYLLNLPFGIDAAFELYRRDTNFINLAWQLGVDYQLGNGRRVEAYWQQQSTNLLSIDSMQLRQTNRLPDTLDVSRRTLGLGFSLARLDYRNNPRQGWEWRLRAGAGQKVLRRNSEISALGLENLYDTLQTRSAQYSFETLLGVYLPLGQRGVFKTGLQAAALVAGQPILANEQYRIGGNRLLRGFDEESIFATNYAIGTFEYRFLLATNSYLYAFYDLARVDASSLSTPTGQTAVTLYQGLGTGITFETRAGLFGLSLAFGKAAGIPFDFGRPKVHFGYVSLF